MQVGASCATRPLVTDRWSDGCWAGSPQGTEASDRIAAYRGVRNQEEQR